MPSPAFHPDWRDWISLKLRRKLKRAGKREPARPYLMRSLDKFARLVPHLRQRHEVALQLDDICKLVNKPGDAEIWTPVMASRFLRYLADINVINVRYSGRSGNSLRLLKNFSDAPDPSRQSGTHRITRPTPEPEGDKREETPNTILEEVEFDPMPTAPLSEPAVTSNETVELDGEAVLAAIDQITSNLGEINVGLFQSGGEPYDAQATISKAMADLQLLRQAVLRGDGTPLEEILESD